MKVVFLDFDGVINNADTLRSEEQEANFEAPHLSMEWWAAGLDKGMVALVNDLLDRTGAKVVVSSSWRMGATTCWLQAVLEEVGFTGEVIGTTPRFTGVDRSEEIAAWVQGHSGQVEQFVILDDDWDANIPGHFIRTSFKVGLTPRHIDKAVAILNGT